MITQDNFELFFIDYIEDALAPDIKVEFERFLDENPELKELRESFNDMKLTPPSISYPFKQSLILEESDFAIRLAPPENIIFEKKHLLYKHRRYQITAWWMPVAAVIALFFTLKWTLPEEKVEKMEIASNEYLYPLPADAMTIKAITPHPQITLTVRKETPAIIETIEAFQKEVPLQLASAKVYPLNANTRRIEIKNRTSDEILLSPEVRKWEVSLEMSYSKNIISTLLESGKELITFRRKADVIDDNIFYQN